MAAKSIRKLVGWALALVLVAGAAPLLGQTGGLTGTAIGPGGKKLAKYLIIITRQDIKGTYKTKTNKKGEYVYIGLPLGIYKVTLEDPSGHPLATQEKHVGFGDPTELDFNLQGMKQAQQELANIKAQKEYSALKDAFDQGNTLYTQQKYADAAQAFAKAVALASGKNVTVVLAREGDAYFKAGDYQKAIPILQQAIAKDPNEPGLHVELANVYARTGDFKAAEKEFKAGGRTVTVKEMQEAQKAASVNKQYNNLKESFAAAEAAYNQGQYAQAAEMFDKAAAFAKDKNLPVVLSRAADSYAKAHQYPQAVAEYQKAIQADPTNANYYNNLGSVYGQMNKPDLAVQEFQKAAQVDPAGAGRYYFNIGAIMENAGKMDQAAAAFKQATQADPNYADAYFLEAQALMGQAKTDANGKVVAPPDAVAALEQYMKIAPNGKYAASAQQMLQLLTGKVQTKYKKH